jgi:hypothetical protein
MSMIIQKAESIDELHKLHQARLVDIGPDGLRWLKPDHPRVLAWKAHKEQLDDDRDSFNKAWLLFECREVLREAVKTNRADTVEHVTAFAGRIIDMPTDEVQEALQYFLQRPTTTRH